MDKVKVAVVGNGGICGFHMSHLMQFDDVEYVGFHDVIPDRADYWVGKTGQGKRYDSYVEMYDDAKPDAVYVCVPPNQHGDIELQAIKRGIHLFVEKPISTDINIAKKISGAIIKSGIISAVGFQDRYLDIIDFLKEELKSREVGIIYGAWVGGIPGVPWWRKMAESGGQIVEQNIHLFDMLRYVIGEPETVYCVGRKGMVTDAECPGYDVDDYSAATITFATGEVCTMFTGDYIKGGGGMSSGLTFVARDARIEYFLRNSVHVRAAKEEENKSMKTAIDQGVTEDRVFIDAVKTGRRGRIRSPYADALKSLAFTLACNESIVTGLPVKVTY